MRGQACMCLHSPICWWFWGLGDRQGLHGLQACMPQSHDDHNGPLAHGWLLHCVRMPWHTPVLVLVANCFNGFL